MQCSNADQNHRKSVRIIPASLRLLKLNDLRAQLRFLALGFVSIMQPARKPDMSKRIFIVKLSISFRLLMTALIGFTLSMYASASSVEDAIADRLKPVGSVCMSGSDCAAAPVAAAPSGPRTGEQVYSGACGTCHGAGIAGAPKFGDAAAWGSRVGKGIDTLYANAIGGINGMPAMGLCMDCSEDEIKAAVDYMVDGSK